MGKPYARELEALSKTLKWALELDIEVIREFVDFIKGVPLIAVGSGGSSTAAHFASILHRQTAGRPASYTTPLDFLLNESQSSSSILVLSASGRNRDVLSVARSAVASEVHSVGSISTQTGSPLEQEVVRYSRGFAFANLIPTGKDGFLATNSLFATLIILARAYRVDLSDVNATPVVPDLDDVTSRRSAIVLHAGWSSPIATDLESRLHESTLLNVQIPDYRNFGHGRHLWLSRRGAESFIVALITPETVELAERTLRLVPNDVPVIRLGSSATGPSATIELMSSALHLIGSLGRLQSFDPGRPQVPAFGRRLFHLAPSVKRTDRPAPPVARKLARFETQTAEVRQVYEDALGKFAHKLAEAELGAVVLDYDGTLCGTRERFQPLTDEMSAACSRLLAKGILLGVASGRGRSVREGLRAAISSKFWASIVVGYYNGSDVAPLSSDDAPDRSRLEDTTIKKVRQVLKNDPIIARFAQLESRPCQITVSPLTSSMLESLHNYILDVLQVDRYGARLRCSGHSIDILAPSASKLRVVKQLEERVKPRLVLCIGDMGAWPGNDIDLLAERMSLSVDKVSASSESCWNLAPPGRLGPEATLQYLDAISPVNGSFRIDVSRITMAS